METINLCGRPHKCCPVLAKEGKKYLLTDKGQKILLTKTQIKMLYNKVF
jgi:hypothetical protein